LAPTSKIYRFLVQLIQAKPMLSPLGSPATVGSMRFMAYAMHILGENLRISAALESGDMSDKPARIFGSHTNCYIPSVCLKSSDQSGFMYRIIIMEKLTPTFHRTFCTNIPDSHRLSIESRLSIQAFQECRNPSSEHRHCAPSFRTALHCARCISL
jgi:hypothetical protein